MSIKYLENYITLNNFYVKAITSISIIKSDFNRYTFHGFIDYIKITNSMI